MEITLPDSDLDGILGHPLVQGLLECGSDGAVVIDAASRRVLGMNQRARDLLADGQDRTGCCCQDVLDTPACAQACPLTRAAQGLSTDDDVVVTYRSPDDAWVHARTRMLVIRGPDGKPVAGIELIQDQRELRGLQRALRARRSLHGLHGSSAAMQRVYDRIERLAPCDLPVLVHGPPGSGKRRVAEALHAVSPRRATPLVVQTAAALAAEPAALGHWLQQAAGGSLLLCRVDDTTPDTLSALADLVRHGATAWHGQTARTNGARLVFTATRLHALPTSLREGIASATITVPGLAERIEDLPLLVQAMLHADDQLHANGMPPRCRPDTLARLVDRPWPGNLGQLRACLHAAALRAAGAPIAPHHLDAAPDHPDDDPLSLADAEAQAIQRALQATDGNVSAAARLLGIDRSTLWRKLKRSG